MPKGNRNATHKETKNTIFYINRKKPKVQKLPFGLKCFCGCAPNGDKDDTKRTREHARETGLLYCNHSNDESKSRIAQIKKSSFCNEN